MTRYIQPVLFKAEDHADGTNGFTFGRYYRVIHEMPSNTNAVTVLNDSGHERFILIGEDSPHIIRMTRSVGGCSGQRCAGYFAEVTPND